MSEPAPLGRLAMDIFRRALDRIHAGRVLASSVSLSDNELVVQAPGRQPLTFPLDRYSRITVIGAGKATAAMAQSLEPLLGERLSRGLVVVKDGHGLPLQRIEVVEAGHPVPDERGLLATCRLRDWLRECGPQDLVIVLLSGGASALLPAPAPGISLADKQEVTRLLLRSGATIQQVNTVRQHLSVAKGGQLALLACPATVLVLLISDVIGDDPAFIASGPFSPVRSSFTDSARIVEELGVLDDLPAGVRQRLLSGRSGDVPELPGADHPAFQQVHTVQLAGNRLALQAAQERARELGFTPLILTSSLQGEARTVAGVLVSMAREALLTGYPGHPPLCLLSGGETTVTVRGKGIGGRNLEMALAAALALDQEGRITFLAAGTDGTDSETGAAGAWCDGGTVARARELGLDACRFLQENDSYTFFQQVGGLVITGPTWTNVMDLQVVLVGSG